jgi:ribonucleoside-diphosphate reductase alpha chain
VIEEVDARELFQKMAEAAWSARPRHPVRRTINDWHTTPESGRITASNPCSEYIAPGQLLLHLAS